MILETNPYRQGEQVGKALLQRFIAGDLAPDVADHAAEPGAKAGVSVAAPATKPKSLPSRKRGVASLCCMPRHCTAIPLTATL